MIVQVDLETTWKHCIECHGGQYEFKPLQTEDMVVRRASRPLKRPNDPSSLVCQSI
jgi:hypothetical protein